MSADVQGRSWVIAVWGDMGVNAVFHDLEYELGVLLLRAWTSSSYDFFLLSHSSCTAWTNESRA